MADSADEEAKKAAAIKQYADAATASANAAQAASDTAKTDSDAAAMAASTAAEGPKKDAAQAAAAAAATAATAASAATDAVTKAATGADAATDTSKAKGFATAASIATTEAVAAAADATSARKVAESIAAPPPRGPNVGAGPPVATTALNQQIVQAVNKTNQVVLGAATTEANGIAYQKVAQAAAFSVQDSTDYLRNIMTIAATTQGVCLQLMVKTPATAALYTPILTAAQGAVTEAAKNFAAVGAASAAVAAAFPSS